MYQSDHDTSWGGTYMETWTKVKRFWQLCHVWYAEETEVIESDFIIPEDRERNSIQMWKTGRKRWKDRQRICGWQSCMDSHRLLKTVHGKRWKPGADGEQGLKVFYRYHVGLENTDIPAKWEVKGTDVERRVLMIFDFTYFIIQVGHTEGWMTPQKP